MKSKSVISFGILFTCMEMCKQIYLYIEIFGGKYNVWYFPFQLCSMPIYLCLIYHVISHRFRNEESYDGTIARRRAGAVSTAIATFLQDYGMLGGIATLMYGEGIQFAGHPILTAHGYVWHILMIMLSLYIYRKGSSDVSWRGFLSGTSVFAITAGMAFAIDVMLHPYGDCDMFYISPYHLSSQPVFRDIDAVIGRPLGIFFYLFMVAVGAGIVHIVYGLVRHRRGSRIAM